MLGLAAIGSLALLRGLLEPSTRPNVAGSWLDDLNAHAALTARLAAKFARPDEASDAFCAALVQESGQLVLASCRPASFQRILSTRHDSAETRRAIELAEFGVTHAQAGAYLLGLWGFPASIVELVAHHDLQPSGPPGRGTQCAADAIRTARAVAHRHLAPICPVEDDHEEHPDDAVSEITREALHDGWLPFETAA
jgi:HD-like signal output (HDOD) protein